MALYIDAMEIDPVEESRLDAVEDIFLQAPFLINCSSVLDAAQVLAMQSTCRTMYARFRVDLNELPSKISGQLFETNIARQDRLPRVKRIVVDATQSPLFGFKRRKYPYVTHVTIICKCTSSNITVYNPKIDVFGRVATACPNAQSFELVDATQSDYYEFCKTMKKCKHVTFTCINVATLLFDNWHLPSTLETITCTGKIYWQKDDALTVCSRLTSYVHRVDVCGGYYFRVPYLPGAIRHLEINSCVNQVLSRMKEMSLESLVVTTDMSLDAAPALDISLLPLSLASLDCRTNYVQNLREFTALTNLTCLHMRSANMFDFAKYLPSNLVRFRCHDITPQASKFLSTERVWPFLEEIEFEVDIVDFSSLQFVFPNLKILELYVRHIPIGPFLHPSTDGFHISLYGHPTLQRLHISSVCDMIQLANLENLPALRDLELVGVGLADKLRPTATPSLARLCFWRDTYLVARVPVLCLPQSLAHLDIAFSILSHTKLDYSKNLTHVTVHYNVEDMFDPCDPVFARLWAIPTIVQLDLIFSPGIRSHNSRRAILDTVDCFVRNAATITPMRTVRVRVKNDSPTLFANMTCESVIERMVI